MTDNTNRKDMAHLDELKEMVNTRKEQDPVGKVLTIFCHRHGISIERCREYYNQLVANGEIKEK